MATDSDNKKTPVKVLARIDQYELLRKLGGGGFGVVYLARDTLSGVEYALKTLHPLLKTNADELERVRASFALTARLSHPNIAAAHVLLLTEHVKYFDKDAERDLHVFPGDPVMLMTYAPGIPLSKWKRQFPGRLVPLEKAYDIAVQVAFALDAAHAEKIIHRDIKPENLMIETCDDGKLRVRVLDFGLAAEIRYSMSRISSEKGNTSGTRPYMAPEQWDGRKQDGRTDQYALACVLYEMLSGAPPFASAFETGDTAVMSHAVASRYPERIRNLDQGRNAVLLRALSKNKEDRFPNCYSFLEAFSDPDAAGFGVLKKANVQATGRVTVSASPVRSDFEKAEAEARQLELEGELAVAKSEIAKLKLASMKAKAKADKAKRDAEIVIKESKVAVEVAQSEVAAVKRDAESAIKKAAADIDVANKAAETAKAEVMAAKREAESAIKKAAADIDVANKAAETAKAEAAAAKREAESAIKKAAADVDVANKATETAKAEVVAAKREAESAIKKAAADVDVANKATETAKAEAAAAKREAESAVKEAAVAVAAANKEAETANAKAEDLKKWAETAVKKAESEADVAKKEAESARSEAESAKREAKAAVKESAAAVAAANKDAEFAIANAKKIKREADAAVEKAAHQVVIAENEAKPANAKVVELEKLRNNAAEKAIVKSEAERKKVEEVTDSNVFAKLNAEPADMSSAGAHDAGKKKTGFAIAESLFKKLNSRFLIIPKFGSAFVGDHVLPVIKKHPFIAGVVSILVVTLVITLIVKKEPNSVNAAGFDEVPERNSFPAGTPGIITLPGGVSLEMVYVSPGTFMMGSDDDGQDERPVHSVTLTKGYWIGKFEVTQKQWKAVMGETNNPSHFRDDDKPVECVSWNDCLEFCQNAGYGLRLPTEAEWEFAARGGTKSNGFRFSGGDNITDVAWANKSFQENTADIGGRNANELGIHDMSGNVWEWCQDWFGCYSSKPCINPQGPAKGTSRVLRGGSWCSDVKYCLCTGRGCDKPYSLWSVPGFRVVCFPEDCENIAEPIAEVSKDYFESSDLTWCKTEIFNDDIGLRLAASAGQ